MQRYRLDEATREIIVWLRAPQFRADEEKQKVLHK